MAENFITHIRVNNSRNVSDLDIPLSETQRKHLIITGKNGSGKTSLLEEIVTFLDEIRYGGFEELNRLKEKLAILKIEQKSISESHSQQLEKEVRSYENNIKAFGGTFISFNNPSNIHQRFKDRNFILSSFSAKRGTNFNRVTGINTINFPDTQHIRTDAGESFLQLLVNRKADRSFARDDEEMETVAEIDTWFDNFENRLKILYKDPRLKLKFDRSNYNFKIIPSEGIEFDFDTLSDGFSAVIRIISDIIMRMESTKAKDYNMEGIVLLDEVETHLHVDLQKEILPFLTSFFPRIQFIVTTHSPFVINSLPNAVICDLEKKIVVEDLTAYSYDALIESYFGVDKYSTEVKEKLDQYESLLSKADKNFEEKQELKKLKRYLESAPEFLSKELKSKLIDLELKAL